VRTWSATIFSNRALARIHFGRTSPFRVHLLPLISGRKILHTAYRCKTRKRRRIFPSPRACAMLFIFQQCALTLPFVYAHKYSFKPPSWYPDEAICLSSLIRDHQSSLDRAGVTLRSTIRKCYTSRDIAIQK